MKKNIANKPGYARRWHEPSEVAVAKTYISAAEVRQIIMNQMSSKIAIAFGIYMGDIEYFCTPLKDAEEIITNSADDKHKWVSDRFDCDDFAYVLKAHFAEAAYADGKRRCAHCFGIAWSSHVLNWMINDDKVLRFVEPQTDNIFLPRPEDENIYLMLL